MKIVSVTKCFSLALLFIASIVGLISCIDRLFVESQDITKGAIEGFKIGMTKQQVLEVAHQKRVSAIRPILRQAVSTNFSNLSSFAFPGGGRAIELSDEGGGKAVFTLSDCKVIGVSAHGALHDAWSEVAGRSLMDLGSDLKNALQKDHELSVREVISSDNHAWFALDSTRSNSPVSIYAYDIWSFEVGAVKPAGSEFVIYFSEGMVVRISYKRPRIRVE